MNIIIRMCMPTYLHACINRYSMHKFSSTLTIVFVPVHKGNKNSCILNILVTYQDSSNMLGIQ